MVEEWLDSGTVSFSSTLSDVWISESSSATCSSLRFGVAAVGDMVLLCRDAGGGVALYLCSPARPTTVRAARDGPLWMREASS